MLLTPAGQCPTFVRPLIESGIPAMVGASDVIYSDAALAFCSKLYQSLAVGLSLDEAVTYGSAVLWMRNNIGFPLSMLIL